MITLAPPMIEAVGLTKTFTLHSQGGVELDVLRDIDMSVRPGECVVLQAPSGSGKSTLLRALFGNYRLDSGAIWIGRGADRVDIVSAPARVLLDIRLRTMGYVSQFLRVIPRVSTFDLVKEPLAQSGVGQSESDDRAASILRALRLPERLWVLAPATFSGGEQQRVNIARALVADREILLLDEPTASLDEENRFRVLDLLYEKRKAGTAMVGIFHDQPSRDALATRIFEIPTRRQLA